MVRRWNFSPIFFKENGAFYSLDHLFKGGGRFQWCSLKSLMKRKEVFDLFGKQDSKGFFEELTHSAAQSSTF
jgi:hypothetical protein